MAKITSGAIKVVEIIGISPKSFDDAVAQAVKKASKSLKGISGVEVVKHSAKIEAGKIVQYKAICKLAFAVK
jgi:flavin-binding protein dodecin